MERERMSIKAKRKKALPARAGPSRAIRRL
jgi:hypothetical protein